LIIYFIRINPWEPLPSQVMERWVWVCLVRRELLDGGAEVKMSMSEKVWHILYIWESRAY
jgi:hypothetical protein